MLHFHVKHQVPMELFLGHFCYLGDRVLIALIWIWLHPRKTTCKSSWQNVPHLCENNLTARVSLIFRHFPYSSRIEPGGMTASCDLSVHVTPHDRDPELTLTCAGECWLVARSRTRSRWSGSASRCRSRRCPGPASRRRARGPGHWRRRAESPGWGRSLPQNLEHEAL